MEESTRIAVREGKWDRREGEELGGKDWKMDWEQGHTVEDNEGVNVCFVLE